MKTRMIDMFLQVTSPCRDQGKTPAVRSLHDAADLCQRHGFAGNLYDEDEIIATVNEQGVIRDLEQQIVDLTA